MTIATDIEKAILAAGKPRSKLKLVAGEPARRELNRQLATGFAELPADATFGGLRIEPTTEFMGWDIVTAC